MGWGGREGRGPKGWVEGGGAGHKGERRGGGAGGVWTGLTDDGCAMVFYFYLGFFYFAFLSHFCRFFSEIRIK